MSDVLFIKTSSLGDVIHHMPALTEARAPPSRAHRFAWVVEKSLAPPLVRLHPAIDEVIPVASRRWRGVSSPPGPSMWSEVWRRFGVRCARDPTMRTRRHAGPGDPLRADCARVRAVAVTAMTPPAFASAPRRCSTMCGIERRARRQHAIARNRALTGLALGYVKKFLQLCRGPRHAQDFQLVSRSIRGAASGHRAAPGKEWPVERIGRFRLASRCCARGACASCCRGAMQPRTWSAAGTIAAEHCQLPDVPDLQPLDAVARLIAGASA